MTRNLTCIVCPKGCSLVVELDGKAVVSISGATCKRGEEYAKTECTAPMRTLTTTVAIEGGGVVAVKTNKPIPKELLFECMNAVNSARAKSGTKIGDVIIKDILGTGADIIATANA